MCMGRRDGDRRRIEQLMRQYREIDENMDSWKMVDELLEPRVGSGEARPTDGYRGIVSDAEEGLVGTEASEKTRLESLAHLVGQSSRK